MTTEGYVKLPRTMLEWGWLDDGNTLRVYLVLLLSANWKDGEWHGMKIRRGQLVTSVNSLCEKCRLTSHKVRTALEHLSASNDITVKTTSQYTIVTLNNYDFEENANNETSNEPQTNDKQIADKTQTSVNQTSTIEERKEEKEKKELKEKEEAPPSFNSPNSSITRDALIEQYGIENVISYERRLFHWKETKGITGNFDDLKTIAKWLAEDNPQKFQGSSFDMNAVQQRILKLYDT